MDNMQIYSSENTNPWIGLDSYKDGQTLYGRSREIQDLSMAVFYNHHTVVYGRSGIGKSSLLHAGIFPEARRRGCLPISIRFDHSAQMGYREQLIRSIVDAVIANGGEVKDLTGKDTEPYSLWEFFHCYQLMRGEETITPLIVIDQFEEIFTLGRNQQQVKDFFEELADLLNDIKPAYLQTTSEQVAQNSSGSLFDNLNIQISDDRYEQEMPFHLVFVLREDYLSYLERYSLRIPPLKQNRFGLLPITYLQAMEIITKPREGLVTNEVADSIIRHIVTENDITDETPVDSAILSLFLNRLYEKKSDASAITRQLVNEYGNALLEDFYAEIVNPLDRRTIHYLEDTLINSDGHRENVSLESLYRNDHIKRSVIEILEHNHLLRIFSYGDVQRVEFAHDVLCPIIIHRRTQRQYAERTRRTKRIGLGSFFGLLLLLFGGMYIIEERLDQKEALARQQERLSEMEVSLIEKGTQKMLDNHDIYGAIQLLINSIDSRESIPSPTTARKEKMLRQAVDSLQLTTNSMIANIHRMFSLSLTLTAVTSPSKRLVGFNDQTGTAVIVDSHTGAIVQSFSKHPVDHYAGTWSNGNKHNWKLYVNEEGTWIMSYEDSDSSIVVKDIHPDDNRCILIADDTTLLDCYIDKNIEGCTRLCIHDIHAEICNAAYSEDGSQIALITKDSVYLLYDANTGMKLGGTKEVATRILYMASLRQHYLLIEDDHHGCRWKSISINDAITIMPLNIRSVCIEREPSRKKSMHDARSSIYYPSPEQKQQMQNYLDTLSSLNKDLIFFPRTYLYNEYDSIYERRKPQERYYWPLALNPKGNRVATLQRNGIYGIYPHNGTIFFLTIPSYRVHTLHFTKDDQYLVVNAGEETQEVIYLPPLETLLDSCKNMFFDWRMTEEERYQTYIHMND